MKNMRKLSGALLALLLVLLLGIGAMEAGSSGESGDKPRQTEGGTEPRAEQPSPAGADDWRLTLVNTENPLSRDYEPDTAEADNGYLFDLRAVESLRALLQAGREAGLDLVVTSGWRSWAYQEQLFEDKVGRVMAETGLGRAEAEELAAAEVARPGTSEHQLGLAVDIISNAHPELDESWAQTEEAEWLKENCADYGFILRYPPDKSGITGIVWELWHFRYVGQEAAQYIMESGLCLEEYLEEQQ